MKEISPLQQISSALLPPHQNPVLHIKLQLFSLWMGLALSLPLLQTASPQYALKQA